MTASPQWSQMDDSTADLLALVADVDHPVGADAPQIFLAACRRDAMAHDGLVSVSRVRSLLAAEDIEHHRLSSFWSAFTGRGKPMVRDGWEPCIGSATGNNGKPYPRRRWVGESA